MANSLMVVSIDVHQLATIIRNRNDDALILDSRSFLEYNASHITNAINVGCAKLMKRRLQQEKLSIEDFLAQNCHWEVDRKINIIVYDQSTRDAKYLSPDSFMSVFLHKLLTVYQYVNILKGGFLEFQSAYPSLCENERAKLGPLTSLSQPCLPVSNQGPTKILPFLYLGSQHDALSRDVLQHYNITYQLNVSTNCPKPDFIQESHFLRIPVIDNYSEKLLPHFGKAFQFLDKVKESGGCALVHCLAGISRSATVAIAYVMKSLKLTSDEAYRYVKAKRATISPNFNFLGQLLEYEKQLQQDCVLNHKSESACSTFYKPSSPFWYNSSKTVQYSAPVPSQPNTNPNCTKYGELKNHNGKSSFFRALEIKDFLSFEQTLNKDFHNIPCRQPTSLNIKCLPVSSLKDLNFTPCQTSSFKPDRILHSPTKSKSMDFVSVKKPDSPCCSSNTSDYHSPEDCKVFDFDRLSYNRSDSTSTSGLGSEGSDYTDSWNEFMNSGERETDILMDDEFLTVPTDDDELHRRKMLGFQDSYEDSLSLYSKCQVQYSGSLQQQVQNTSQTVPNKDTIQRFQCNSRLKLAPGYFPPNADSVNLLYRAQSCPGMLSSESESPNNSVRLRSKATKLNKDDCRNRFSCSSIDYIEYPNNGFLSRESCPPTLHVGTSSECSSHYRNSMIQVS